MGASEVDLALVYVMCPMRGATSDGDDRSMIIDPQALVAIEMDRHLAAAEAAMAFRDAPRSPHPPRRRRPRRGVLVRLATWATGRAVHA
ncbi:MAG: hypothetical protein JWQ91_3052 [Aeromicrobium sp.]|nr:hypothetical protein [Aeromicrobium sp.]